MRPTTPLAALAGVALAALATPALAHPSDAPQPSQPQPPGLSPAPAPTGQLAAAAPRTESYGWHIVGADLATLGATLVSAAALADSDSGAPGLIFSGGYLLGGPIVHIAHDNGSRAVYSFGLRLTMPVLGAVVGVAIDDCHEDEWMCGAAGFVLGGTAGLIAASAIDATVLAEKETTAADAHLVRVGSVAADPVVSVAGDRAFVGLAGSF